MFSLGAAKVEEPPHVFDLAKPLPTARTFVKDTFEHDGYMTLRQYGGQFLVWDGVCYREWQRATVIATMYPYLEKAFRLGPISGEPVPFDPTKKKVNEVLSALEAVTHLPTNVISVPGWLGKDRASRPDPRELVSCSNGILHLHTSELLPSTPEFFSTNALNFPFEPNAPEPTVWSCLGLVESCLLTPGLPFRTGPGSGIRALSGAGSDCRTRRCIWPPRSRPGCGSARRPARSVRT